MRTHGTLSKWNDERGFGFVTPAQAGAEIFVHISAFPADGTRPRIGEIVSFEITQDAAGRKRAADVMRPGAARTPRIVRGDDRRAGRRLPKPLLSIALLLIVAVLAYTQYSARTIPIAPPPQFAPLAAPQSNTSPFRCDGRTHCSQMRSCAEAMYFLQHCPNTRMDGNNDGEPCEQQWCR